MESRMRSSLLLALSLVACSGGDSSRSGASLDSGLTDDASSSADSDVPDGQATSDAGGGDGSMRSDGGVGGEAFSFVIVGCNRVEKADITTGNPSTANLEQLRRTFADVAALQPPPKFFFFAGDMVYGYTDEVALQQQLTAWLALWTASPLPALGVQLVPLPGNHESQHKSASTKLAYAAAETTWVSVMSAYIRGSNGPAAGGADGLMTDQSKLSYSFDHAGTHFVVLNSDPVGADGTVPAKWIASDITAARGAGAKHVFAMSHKPAYPSPLSNDGIAVPAVRDAFWAAMEAGQAEAMLSAHNHLWYKTRPNKTWQIVAGNGGSLLEMLVSGSDAYYGFTLVDVAANGTVTAKSYGRDVPAAGYIAPAGTGPTTIRDTFDITWH